MMMAPVLIWFSSSSRNNSLFYPNADDAGA
jgi:hypothetical protein